jgi:hypothetical protein
MIIEILMFAIIASYLTHRNKLEGVLSMFFLSLLLIMQNKASIFHLFVCLVIILTARWTKKAYKIPTLEIIGIFLLVGLFGYIFNKNLIFLPTEKIIINHYIGIFITILSFINIAIFSKYSIEKKQYIYTIFATIIMCYVCLFFGICNFDIVLFLINIVFLYNNRQQ